MLSSGMKKAVASIAVVGGLLFVASPAEAANNWRDQSWRDMRSLAPEGARETGRSATLQQVRRTCTYLNRGYRASDILEMYFSVAAESANSRRELSDMYSYSMALMAVAGTRLCPRHRYAIARALDF